MSIMFFVKNPHQSIDRPTIARVILRAGHGSTGRGTSRIFPLAGLYTQAGIHTGTRQASLSKLHIQRYFR